MSGSWRAVARVADVGPGDIVAIEVDGVQMIIGRDGEAFFAAQRRCLHRGGDLADGIVSRGHVVCPHHGWRFSTATGCAADAPEFCLVTFAVRVVGDQIEVDPRPQGERAEHEPTNRELDRR